MVSQCSIGPRPGRARQMDSNASAGAALENRNTNCPLFGSNAPPSYFHFVGSEYPFWVIDGRNTSGTGATSQEDAGLTVPSCVTTGTPCATVTVIAVSSVDRRQEFSLSAPQIGLQQPAMDARTTSRYFIQRHISRGSISPSRLDDRSPYCQQ